MTLHALVLRGIHDEYEGVYRSIPVRISGSSTILPRAQKVPDLMEKLGYWLEKEETLDPFNKAIEAHYELVTIHPFVDGNGRTARLLMNMILIRYGYPPAIIRKKDRLQYVSVLEKAQTEGGKDPYIAFMEKCMHRSFDLYLKAIEGDTYPETQSLGDTWSIGQIAAKTGLLPSTIRHWTKAG